MKRAHEPFNVRLYRTRSDRAISMHDLCVATGISLVAQNANERGTRIPRYEALRLLAVHLDVSADYLAGFTDERSRLPSGVTVATEFADRIKHVRAERNLSQYALTRILKTTRERVGRWERDQFPSYWSLVEIAAKCKVSVDWLLGLSEQMEASCAA